MRVFNKRVANAINSTSGYTSPYIPLKSIYLFSIAAIMTGSPSGTIKLQASNDPETNDTQTNSSGTAPAVGPTNWVDIANSTFTISASGETMWNVTNVAYNYVRVVYAGSGSSTTTIIFNGKGV